MAGSSGSELRACSAYRHGVAALSPAAIGEAGSGVRAYAIAPGSIDTPMMGVIERTRGGDERLARAIRGSAPPERPPDLLGALTGSPRATTGGSPGRLFPSTRAPGADPHGLNHPAS